ncbi:FISUMP domain-containing protein [Sporocytophaga myxococcoides]|uniref:FISUMP domain-containing protein n=1 Tax=Sporocytophaga myxococcoides TaxID=153721 RepID=UPI00068628FA|nr:FISUMP domain-containing protein [Sporocytophaga myxococcoides]
MKKLMLSWTLVLAIAGLTFMSCGKDKGDNNPVDPNAGTVKDERDQIVYKTIKIGNQTWFAEDLRYDGPLSQGNSCNPSSGGKIYDLDGAKVACPNGWRLPSDLDFRTLENYLGMSNADTAKIGYGVDRGVDKGIGLKLQNGGSTGFNFTIPSGPANSRDVWTSTKISNGNPNGDILTRTFSRNDNSIDRGRNFEGGQMCVRCLKN